VLKTLKYFPAGLIALSSLVVLLVYILLGHYAHPSADDFCMITGVRQDGFFPHLWHHYLEWSGRYAGNAFYAIYLLVFGISDGYQLMPVLLIFLLLLSTAFFLSSLFRVGIRTPTIVLMSTVFVTVFLSGMRDLASSLYWTAGALTYQSANIFLLTMLGLMIRLNVRQVESKKMSGIFIALITVVIAGIGTHETNMLVVVVLLFISFMYQLQFGWYKARLWLLLLILSVICSSVVFLSPGNIVRESTFPLRHDFFYALNGSLNMGFKTLGIWLSSPLLITSTLLMPFAVNNLYQRSSKRLEISTLQIIVLIFTSLSVPFVLQFPAWWAMGGWPPARTVDAIYFVFVLSWLSTVGALTLCYKDNVNILSNNKKGSGIKTVVLSIGAILFVASIATNSKVLRAANDLIYRAEPYQEYMHERYSLIEDASAENNLTLTVPEYSGKYPRSIYFNDIRRDPRDWRNVCYAEYFGLQGISRRKLRVY